jgi:hypothetical protein
MAALEQAQRAMMRAIALGPDHVPDTLFAGGRRAALRGLAVHANTISHARLVALEDSFPHSRRMLGEGVFNALSRAFLESGAGTGALARIGRDFPVWLADRDQPPGATDLARFEWTWLQCYHAADSPALLLSELAEIGPDGIADLVLVRHPASAVLELHADARVLIEAEFGAPLPLPYVLLARPDATVRVASADPAVALLHAAFQKPQLICNLLAQSPEPGVQDALLALIAMGALVRAEREGFPC